MLSQRISLLLLLAALTRAQETTPTAATPTPPSASSPPFPLDSNGEAHFNIPVVVKLADLTNGASAGAAPSAAAAAAVAARDVDAVEPVFEVAHQGVSSSPSSESEDGELKARNDMDAGAAAAMGTHTVVLVETTGTSTRTVTESCTDPAAPGRTNAIANSSTNANTTAPAPVADTTTADEAGKVPPVPSNHTGFPLRNGTEGSLPCNSTGHATGAVKPTGAGLVAGAAKPSGSAGAEYHNPANMAGAGNGSKPFMGAAARMVGGGSSVGGLVAVVMAGIVGVAAF